jgi:hypothetical protein
MSIVVKYGEYSSLPMSEELFWNRVGWLRYAMLNAESFDFRLIYFHKFQAMMRHVP